MSIKGQTLHINGLDFNVVVEGEGPDVLLIHGFPDSNAVWRNQIPALVEAGFRVIAPDQRGFGESTAPEHVTDYRIDRYVADLVAILDELGVEKARVAGHDWGAAVGWQLCMQQTERVDRYAAISVGHPSAYARDGIAGKLRAYYIGFFQIRGVSEKAVAANDWWLWRRMLRYDGEMDTWKVDLSRPGRLTAAINIYRANPTMLVAHDWPTVSVPVLGIWGERDVALVESQMIDSHKYVTGPWRYERVEGGTHWVQLEAPEKTTSLLLDFFA
ncbi:MAG: alpha/beta hydrolase [Thermoleophilia bacterium]|nr:alpha/beta hydrolase [Thermoleophilia bacterium]